MVNMTLVIIVFHALSVGGLLILDYAKDFDEVIEDVITGAIGFITLLTNYLILYIFILFLGRLKIAEIQIQMNTEKISTLLLLGKVKKYQKLQVIQSTSFILLMILSAVLRMTI